VADDEAEEDETELDVEEADDEAEEDETEGDEDVVHIYSVSRFGPPQISAVLPLQVISQRALPSGAGPPPF
jgi:hypothetical protein